VGRATGPVSAALLVIVLALMMGGAVFALRVGAFFDEVEYWQFAQGLLRTGTYSSVPGTPTAFKVPGVPLILAALQWLGLGFTGSRLLFVLLLPLGALLSLRWMRSWGVPFVPAAWATVFAFSNPALVASSGTLYPQLALGVSYVAAMCLWSASERAESVRRRLLMALSAGAILGVSTMLVSTSVVVVGAMLVWAAWRARHKSERAVTSRAGRAAAIAVAGLGLCLVVAPWLIRNAVVMGRFPLVSTSGGVTLLGGNSPGSTVDNGPETRLLPEDKPPAGLSEVAMDQFYRERALEHIRQEPVRYGLLYVHKVAYGLWPTAVTATHGANRLGDLVQRTYYAFLYAGLLGWALLVSRATSEASWIAKIRPYFSLSLLIAVTSLLSYAAFFTRLRYRLPTDIPIGLFAGLGLYLAVAEWVKRRQQRAPSGSPSG
jgi:hypothetical protein